MSAGNYLLKILGKANGSHQVEMKALQLLSSQEFQLTH